MVFFPAKIRLSKDYVGRETTFISVEVVDKDGNLCPWAEDLIYFISEGDCTVLATDNGNQTSMERMRVVATPSNPYPSAQRKAFFGKCLVVVSGHGSLTDKFATLSPDVIEF